MTPMSENKGLMYALFGVGVFSVALAGNFLPEVILASNLKFENRSSDRSEMRFFSPNIFFVELCETNRSRVESVYKRIKKNCSKFD